MTGHIDPRLLEVLRKLPPLMPQFLQRRRVGVPVVDELAARLGTERHLIFTLLHVDTTQSIYGRDEVTLAELRAYNPYQVIDDLSGPLAQLKEKGLVRESAEAAFRLSPNARDAVDTLHTEGTVYVAKRMVLPIEDTEKLARELRQAADAVAANPALGPRQGSHMLGFLAKARYGDPSAPMVRIEQAIGELWGARDDAYMAAWREADMEGPPLEVLSLIWSGVGMVAALSKALKWKQTPRDIESSLTWLVEREYAVRDGDHVSLTPQGVMAREDIENETDRVYFVGWPYTLDEAIWVRHVLDRLVERLDANHLSG
jgi:hypothetical protein